MIALLAMPLAVHAEGKLTVYGALDDALLAELVPAFEAENPGIEVDVIRDSAGPIVARLLAEKANPQADVVTGIPANALVLLKQQGMLEPYKPKDFDKLKPGFFDQSGALLQNSAREGFTSRIQSIRRAA